MQIAAQKYWRVARKWHKNEGPSMTVSEALHMLREVNVANGSGARLSAMAAELIHEIVRKQQD